MRASRSSVKAASAARVALVGNFPRLAAKGGSCLVAGRGSTPRAVQAPRNRAHAGRERGQLLRRLHIVGRTCPQRREKRVEQRALAAREDLCRDVLLGEARGQVAGAPDVVRLRLSGERLRRLHDARGQLVEIRPAVEAGDAIDHVGVGSFGQRLRHLGHKQAVGRLVEFGEAGGDARLERVVAEEGGAEGVDRLDLEPARRLDRGGEEGARLAEVDGAFHTKRTEFVFERRVLQHRPCAEPGEEAVLHLARRRLGVGEAEDAARVGARQKEPRHAVGQHACLAGAGVGRQPRGPRGIGCGDLRACRVVRRGHGTSSGLGVVPSSHSP
jgi:hypothetical protein